MEHRKRYQLNEAITFELGSEFLILDEVNNEGERRLRMVAGPSVNDDGQTVYRFSANITFADSDGENNFDDGDQPMGTALMDSQLENNPNVRARRINGQPAAQFVTVKTPLNFGGTILKLFAMGIQVPFTSNRAMTLLSTVTLSEDAGENRDNYQMVLEAVKTIRVHGKALNLNDISAADLMEAITPDFEENEEGAIGMELRVRIQKGDDEAEEVGSIIYNRDGSTTLKSNGEDEDNEEWDDEDDEDDEGDDLWSRLERLRRLNDELEELLGKYSDEEEWDYPTVTPDEYLYSHYGRLKREHDRLSSFGTTVIINGQGTDFQPLDLLDILESVDQNASSVYQTIKAANVVDSYALEKSALKMAQVFRVDRAVFNSKHDREAGIREGMYAKKYMLSALRSFAWTLAQKADDEGKNITDYDFEELSRLGEFIEAREWLNYESGSWFDGLCGHSDIHVLYAPKQIFDKGLASTLSSMLNNNPVCSLHALRADLEALEGVMGVIHNGLLENRDRSEALEGPLADVLNAWCALCVAAKEPFFSEDGPRVYFYSYPDDRLDTSPVRVSSNGAVLRKGVKKENVISSVQTDHMKLMKSADGREHFVMGVYSQKGKKDPIEWMVLKKEGNRALVLSVYALEARAIGDACWENAELRSWLNGEFYQNVFNAQEKSAILAQSISNSTVQSDKTTKMDANTTDRIFLLNADEALSLLPTAQERIAKATPHAKQNGAEISDGPDQCHWWLRGPGFMMWAPRIQANGEGNRWGIYSGEVCVRPALWVDLSQFEKDTDNEPVSRSTYADRDDDGSDALEQDANGYYVVGKGKTRIGDSAYEKRIMKKVRIADGVKEIGEWAFLSCEIEELLLPDGLEKIGPQAFGYNDIKFLTIPDSVTEIELDAFASCYGMVSVTLGKGIRHIRRGLYDARQQKEIIVPEGVESLGADAFLRVWIEQSPMEIRTLSLPSTLAQVDKNAFGENVQWLSQLVEAHMPKATYNRFKKEPWMKLLEDKIVFSDEQAARKVEPNEFETENVVYTVVGKGAEVLDYLASYSEEEKKAEHIRIADDVNKIEEGALCKLVCMKSLIVPEGVTSMSALSLKNEKLEKIKLPSTLQELESDFMPFSHECKNLRLISMPKELAIRMGACHAFRVDRDIIHLTDGAPEQRDAYIQPMVDQNGVLRLNNPAEVGWNEFGYAQNLKKAIVPAGVKKIGSMAFGGDKALEEVEMPEGIEEIAMMAFSGCTSLRNVELPQTLKKMEGSAFNGCSSLESIVIPDGVEEIGGGTFEGCRTLSNVALPQSLKRIGDVAFHECLSLESIVIPDGAEEIGERTFEGCRALSNVVLPQSLKRIGDEAFCGCASLRTLVLPDGLGTIGKRAFADDLRWDEDKEYIATALESIAIPAGVREIEEEAFKGCVYLKRVTFGDGEIVLGENLFAGCEVLEEVMFGNGVEKISKKIFAGCKNLRIVRFPNSVTEIDGCPFGTEGRKAFVPDSLEKVIFGADSYELFKGRTWVKAIPKTKIVVEGSQAVKPESTRTTPDALAQNVAEKSQAVKPESNRTKPDALAQNVAEKSQVVKPESNRTKPDALAQNVAEKPQAVKSKSNFEKPDALPLKEEKERMQREQEEAAGRLEKIRQLKSDIRTLENEKANLRGLFKGGKRRKLDAEIERMTRELRFLETQNQ